MTRKELIEAIARAMAECEPRSLYGDAVAALAALEAAGVRLVNFAALAEDDAAVEKVARAMLADELKASKPVRDFDETWADEQLIWISNARAALSALKTEVKP